MRTGFWIMLYLHPKVCKMMAFRAVIMGLGLLFYMFWGLGTWDYAVLP